MDNDNGNKIREKRKELALSISELSKISNISEKDIKSYEKNEVKASKKTIIQFAKVTNTNVNDWVDDIYFKRTMTKINTIKKEVNPEEVLTSLFTAINRSDNLLEILYPALLEMNEINSDLELSRFAEKLLISVTQIKLKYLIKNTRELDGVENNKGNYPLTKSKDRTIIDYPVDYTSTDTLDKLINECKEVFKESDKIDIIVAALYKIGEIDINTKSKKAILLLETIMSHKIKNALNNNILL